MSPSRKSTVKSVEDFPHNFRKVPRRLIVRQKNPRRVLLPVDSSPRRMKKSAAAAAGSSPQRSLLWRTTLRWWVHRPAADREWTRGVRRTSGGSTELHDFFCSVDSSGVCLESAQVSYGSAADWSPPVFSTNVSPDRHTVNSRTSLFSIMRIKKKYTVMFKEKDRVIKLSVV